ncbi:hypothetical protein HQ865_01615 [Mucilaginibacter mali]|uniref:HEPN domain-containing protein n=1 Tax=Mucilaginibacter mali TaxID=2740462 RepID=A0A7D4QPD4_9SPHI|nr:hypothetical protein [Mucilaginibacter mali]QKJ28509.1 hypothetical protein HQ865_01615 [Mucilaginibacter mali]
MKTVDEIDEESKQGANIDGGLHVWLINQMTEQMSASNPYEATKFNDTIGNLKRARVKSDYKNFEIKENFAKKAYDTALDAQKLLIKHFKI